ncbi:Aste57867_1958 [Aphanomyces stellatus]|uniref:Aste57867_1958 protein n=1 Tax=Aphanomyces stellatus TaxID=120398 RepID=A0A485K7H3_9STRA|nr:hypothetical protein As57867_001956 [Aphanomyces stellatus]VFT79163.1 Aste57867_1958 [Aphanomyces stellatus]
MPIIGAGHAYDFATGVAVGFAVSDPAKRVPENRTRVSRGSRHHVHDMPHVEKPTTLRPSGSYLHIGVTQVAATLDEIIEIVQTRTNDQARANAQRFGKQLVYAVKL